MQPTIRSASLRSKIIAILGMFLIPAAVFACTWTVVQDRRLHEIKLAAATRAAQRAADDIDSLLRGTALLAATQFSPNLAGVADRERCQVRMAEILRERRDYSISALIVNGELICFHDTVSYFSSDRQAEAVISNIRAAMADQLSRSFSPAFVRSPNGRYLILGVNVPADAGTVVDQSVEVIFALRVDVLAYAITSTRLGIDRGTAIMSRDGEIIVQSSSVSPTDDWFPEDPDVLLAAAAATLASRPISARSRSGHPSRYFTAATMNPNLMVMTGYRDALLFATERSILLSSLLPPLVMLIAAAVGALWAVQRFVVRWVAYLQRITRVYGSGRLSVRAVHIADAPREIAELGVSFNQMADNLANHTRQRERAVHEKDTLLRELHHRVKNNFQVIVSLLSLRKRALSGDKGVPDVGDDGLRFIEDHVQAMSIAYRVGYSSGDLGEAPPAELMHDVIDCLRRSAGLAESDIIEEPLAAGHAVDLDRAIGITLYFAAALPAYLDAVGHIPEGPERPKVRISAVMTTSESPDTPGVLRLTFVLVPPRPVKASPLQERLARAYIRQLNATPVPDTMDGERTILVPLQSAQAH